jgi:hypothetical protein
MRTVKPHFMGRISRFFRNHAPGLGVGAAAVAGFVGWLAFWHDFLYLT